MENAAQPMNQFPGCRDARAAPKAREIPTIQINLRVEKALGFMYIYSTRTCTSVIAAWGIEGANSVTIG
jgi:hypothetical protein